MNKGFAIVVGQKRALPQNILAVLEKLCLEPVFVQIPPDKSKYRVDAIQPFVDGIQAEVQKLGKTLDGLSAVVSLVDDNQHTILAKAARSALIKLTFADPIMISLPMGKLVIVQGDESYPIPA